jgi:hypothetical protein
MGKKSFVKVGDQISHVKLRNVVKNALDGLRRNNRKGQPESYNDCIARLIKRRDFDIINGEIVMVGKLTMEQWAKQNVPPVEDLRNVDEMLLPEEIEKLDIKQHDKYQEKIKTKELEGMDQEGSE